MAQKILVILGPTASGKTVLGIELAKKNNGSIISADSRQVYAELNIGTAKPKEAWQNTVHAVDMPDQIDTIDHFLLNIRSPKEIYTASEWKSDAEKIIKSLITQNKQPILVGGTMLYIDSILYNFSMPQVAPNKILRGQLDLLSTTELQKRLQNTDSAAFDFIESHHRQRMIRALEVIESSGQKFSELRKKRPSPYEFEIIGIFPGWEKLEENIKNRSQEMLDNGLVEETNNLQKKYGSDLPLLKTINYAQALDADPLPAMVRATMRYAHRQISWWKRNKEIKWITSSSATP